MVLGISIGLWMLILGLAVSPLALLVLYPYRRGEGLGAFQRILSDYGPHIGVFVVLYAMKNFVDTLNDPVLGVLGDFTYLVYAIEGDLVLWIQQTFQHPALTWILNANYLFGYIFLTYFSFIIAAYADDRELANKMVLSILVVYLLATPFYVFFNVRVTGDYVAGMDSLLYHSSATYFSFFSAIDPLDNAWPSLHIAIPFAFATILWWTRIQRNRSWSQFPYRRYLWLVAVQLAVFMFSILYLGIHWIIDIPGGLWIGYLGAVVTEEIHRPVFERLDAWWLRLRGWIVRRAQRFSRTR